MKLDAQLDPFVAPCLNDGPIMSAAWAAIDVAGSLGTSPAASLLRALSVPFVFEGMERVFKSDVRPLPPLVTVLEQLTGFLEAAHRAGLAAIGPQTSEEPIAPSPSDIETVTDVTGGHYGRLFREFSSESFWREPERLLRERLDRNGIPRDAWENKRVLDAGCGGGRYTVAWRLVGAREVVGVDVSETGVQNARARLVDAGIEGVTFESGNVLDLPFESGTFDVAFSNGVLHHTVDWQRGVDELVRVMRRGGLGWLYLIERPGGLFWDVIEILRAMMFGVDRNHARRALQALGLPANRVFYMLDHVMVPINVRLTPEEIEHALANAGACGIRRLTRGADFDRIEALHRRDPFAEEKYGVGENRYVFSKA